MHPTVAAAIAAIPSTDTLFRSRNTSASDVPPLGERHWGTIYDVSLDGRRVYFPHETGQRAPLELDVVLGWRALFK